MTTKIISGYYAGYTLSAAFSGLDVTSTGEIASPGLTLAATAKVTNDGHIFGADGLTANGALTLVNGSASDTSASIEGTIGVNAAGGPATVTNFGGIDGDGAAGVGVFLADGGTLTNGAANFASATVYSDGSGVTAGAAAKIVNFGRIGGYNGAGVYMQAGGSVTNGSTTDFQAQIIGLTGVLGGGAQSLTVTNFRRITALGTATAAVTLIGGGAVTNGSSSDTLARIDGHFAGVDARVFSTVINFGTITAYKQQAISLQNAGLVVNGTSLDPTALIEGATEGVNLGAGVATLRNFGTIETTVKGTGVLFQSGGVTNGSTASAAALIEGVYHGVEATGATASVANFGLIEAVGDVGSTNPIGVYLKAGGAITNGAANDTTAAIETGPFGLGILSLGVAKVSNFGTVSGFSGEAVVLSAGGSLANGSGADTKALLFGVGGVTISGGAGTVTNFGSIISYGAGLSASLGVDLETSGAVTNGGGSDTHALIEGAEAGVFVAGVGTVANFGTIEGASPGAYAAGAELEGGKLTNGSATNKTALITGGVGVFVSSGSTTTVTNFGTIHGADGTAVNFTASGDILNVEAGSAFQGVSQLDGGVLNLAGGVGTLTGFTSAGNVTVSGSMAAAKFDDFCTLKIAAGARFTDTGVVSVGAGRTVINAGTLSLGGGGTNSVVNAGQITTSGGLTLAGAVKNSGAITVAGGSLAVSGTVTGAGSVTINGGAASFASAFAEKVTFTSKGGTLALARSRTYSGAISGFAKTAVSVLDLEDITFTSGTTKASYSGTTASGLLTVTDGTQVARIKLIGNYTHSTFTTSGDGHGGTTVTDPPAPTGAAILPLVSAMAALDGGLSATAHLAPWEAAALLRPLAGTHVQLQ